MNRRELLHGAVLSPVMPKADKQREISTDDVAELRQQIMILQHQVAHLAAMVYQFIKRPKAPKLTTKDFMPQVRKRPQELAKLIAQRWGGNKV